MTAECKLVFFNRRETENGCDKVEYEKEIWMLRDSYQSAPKIKNFECTYICQDDNNENFETNLMEVSALNKQDAELKFKNYSSSSDKKLHLKSIKEKVRK